MDRLLRVDEVCARLALGRTRVYELIQSGELVSLHVGAARRVPESALAQFITDRLEGKDLPHSERAERQTPESVNLDAKKGARQ